MRVKVSSVPYHLVTANIHLLKTILDLETTQKQAPGLIRPMGHNLQVSDL
jgi:hypothetical protein